MYVWTMLTPCLTNATPQLGEQMAEWSPWNAKERPEYTRGHYRYRARGKRITATNDTEGDLAIPLRNTPDAGHNEILCGNLR